MEWLNMFSGGLDIIPILLAFFLLYYIPKAIAISQRGHTLIYYVSMIMALCMIIAQTGWVYAVTQDVYLLGTAFDNIWLIVNTCAVLIPIMLAHERLNDE